MDMKAFFIPVLDGYYNFDALVTLAPLDDAKVREFALKYHDSDYVSKMMDGEGSIEIIVENGKYRYVR